MLNEQLITLTSLAEDEPENNVEQTNEADSTPNSTSESESAGETQSPEEDSARKLFHPNSHEEPEEPDYGPAETIDLEDLKEETLYSDEERDRMLARYLETMREFKSGELVMGKIVSITDNDASVDIGFKSEGNIPLEEFDHPEDLNISDEIEVCIDSIEDSEGTLVLSKRKAEFVRVWEKINDLYMTGEMVEAQIVRRIKGGMVVDLFGVEAFLPGSQIDVHPVRDFDALVGATMDFRIIKVNNQRKNVVLSHKVLVEESLREIREKVLAELEEGQVVEGIVKNITDFGVFVDLGGVDGLLHITDLSWGRVSHPSDVVELDQKIEVKVLKYDKERQRISLGLKQLQESKWDKIDELYPVNAKVKGKVISIVKYGAFVELEEGVEGLVHISEMSWTQHIKHPSQLVNVGDEIEVVVLSVDKENRKISLGIKQVEEDPWERLEQVYLKSTRHKGIVRDLVPFGAFVELEPGIDGLIHISDLSWTRKVRHPGEIVKKGEEIEVVILNFDKNERRIALGYKQLEDDPWDDFEKEYPIRSRTEGSVIRLLEKGVVVMLPLGVEGFVPNSQLGKSLANENKKKLKEGDNMEIEVIDFDKSNHRIVLSHSIVERQKERAAYRTYQDSTDDTKTTIGDLIQESPEGESPAQTPSGEFIADEPTPINFKETESESSAKEKPVGDDDIGKQDKKKDVKSADEAGEADVQKPLETPDVKEEKEEELTASTTPAEKGKIQPGEPETPTPETTVEVEKEGKAALDNDTVSEVKETPDEAVEKATLTDPQETPDDRKETPDDDEKDHREQSGKE